MIVRFTVPGIPTAKGRARAFVRNGHVDHYTPDKTVAYETKVKAHAEMEMQKHSRPPFACACALDLELYMPIPASWSKKLRLGAEVGLILPTTKPDCSNILKAIEDAMNGVVWRDDKQMVNLTLKKRYSTHPRAVIEVRAI